MRPLAVNVAQQAALYRGPTGVMPIWESVEIDDRERERERESSQKPLNAAAGGGSQGRLTGRCLDGQESTAAGTAYGSINSINSPLTQSAGLWMALWQAAMIPM